MAQGDLLGTFSVASNDITNPFVATGSVAVSVGDLVYCVLGEVLSLTVTAVTDNLGNTYSPVTAGRDSGAVTARAFYSRVTVAGTITSLSATVNSSTNNAVFVGAAFQGPFVVSPLDANPADGEDTNTPYTCPLTGVLSQANELVCCYFCPDASGTGSATSPNLKAVQDTAGASITVVIGYQTVAATTSIAPAFTGISVDLDSVLGTASFKFASPAGRNFGYAVP